MTSAQRRPHSRKRKIIQPGDGDPRHGTANGYNNLRCGWQPDGSRQSCKDCRNAWADKSFDYLEAHPVQREKALLRNQRYQAGRKAFYGVPYEQL